MKSLSFVVLFCLVLFGCTKENPPPTASLTSFPAVGDTTILFELNASKSLNYKGLTNALSYRWDFEGDSSWDTDYSSESSIGHYFINPGLYRIVVEVTDFFGMMDTASTIVTVFGMNKNVGRLIDPRDGQFYRTVRLRDSWWMAENLRYGVTIDQLTEQSDNGVIEMYRWGGPGNGDTIGGTYRWQEAMNYNLNSTQGICPDGWHLPTVDEYNELFNGLTQYSAIKFYGPRGLSGLRLDISNNIWKFYMDGQWSFYSWSFGFWSSGFRLTEGQIIPGDLYFHWDWKTWSVGYQPDSGPENNQRLVMYLPVRCKKD